jgi:hypothetical protein
VDSVRSQEEEAVGSCEMQKKLSEDLSNCWLMETDYTLGKV